jgi:hypothetical protein
MRYQIIVFLFSELKYKVGREPVYYFLPAHKYDQSRHHLM